MRGLFALQHCHAEYLGLIEEHLEGRGIRFQYVRPFTADGKVPGTAVHADGLILLGGGAWGTVGSRPLPTLDAEIRLTRDFLARRRPIFAWGLGAQILALAAGGAATAGDLAAAVEIVTRTGHDALAGYLPERFPLVTVMRDRPRPPSDARILAVDAAGGPAVFQIGANAVGFTGHPGMKPGLLEDLIMEIDDPMVDGRGAAADPARLLDDVRAAQQAIADALVPIMTGLVQVGGLMRPYSESERKRRTTIPIQR